MDGVGGGEEKARVFLFLLFCGMRIWRNNEKELARVVGVVGEGGEGDGSRHVHPPSSSARATGCCVCTSSLAVPRLRQGAEMLIAEENCKTSASIAARATHMLRKVVNERWGESCGGGGGGGLRVGEREREGRGSYGTVIYSRRDLR